MLQLGKRGLVFLVSLTFAISCQNEKNNMIKAKAPVAKKVPKELTYHNDTRVDDYYWLKDMNSL